MDGPGRNDSIAGAYLSKDYCPLGGWAVVAIRKQQAVAISITNMNNIHVFNKA
jgi:hypothetical protein